ncbi:MAG: hypothetical protein DME69_03120 [Verrucomicrobia bacterium]|nr:MAG: hypothetical protein DME69_03120 [Verrucomicrobiota bacterium]
MPVFKRRTAWRGFAVVLPFALCISIGMLVGIHGGLHNEAAAHYRSDELSAMNGIHGAIRLYGALVFLTILSASALTTVALFVCRMFPASHRTDLRLRIAQNGLTRRCSQPLSGAKVHKVL